MYPDSLCLSDAGAWHREQEGSTPQPLVQVLRCGSIIGSSNEKAYPRSQMSPRLSFLFARFSELGHWDASSCLLISSKTSPIFCLDVALWHWRAFGKSPRPALPCWTWPTTSLKRSADFALCTASNIVRFLPTQGAAARAAVSSESVRLLTNFPSVHLSSSTRLVIGNSSLPFLCNPAALKHCGGPLLHLCAYQPFYEKTGKHFAEGNLGHLSLELCQTVSTTAWVFLAARSFW